MTISSKQKELRDVRRICFRGALLLFPFLVLQLLELFVLPIDFFTFRVWEAALATPYQYPGAFYPNLHVKKAKEYGDYYRSGDPRKVQAKPVEWFTDAYGLRNRPEIEKKDHYDIIVGGDSNIVGAFLDQKDTLSETLGTRSGKIGYSYSIAHNTIGLFFSDPRMAQKTPDLLVIQTKVFYWNENNSHLINFHEMPDGSLDVVNQTREFTTNYYSPTRRPFLEKIKSRLIKQPMIRWLKAELPALLSVQRSKSKTFVGKPRSRATASEPGWRPNSWRVSNEVCKPLPGELQPALTIRATGPDSYWHTERFVASHADGRIIVRFDAKNSVTPSRHRIHIFEDGSHRLIGEFVAGNAWSAFEIPISTNPGSILELQIAHADDWQWLSIRDFQVVGGSPLPLIKQTPVPITMATWTGDGSPCNDSDNVNHDCRQWPVTGGKGYIQTPVLPKSGKDGLLIRFEARTDRPTATFTPIWLFEGEKHRTVAQYAFSSKWREFELFLQPDRTAPIKIQFNFQDPSDGLITKEQMRELTMQINRSPLFESSQGWGPGFAKATGHGKGVVVGLGTLNSNVFAQLFPANAYEPFKIVARASSVDKQKAMGRFQINWIDSAGKFISTSIKPFEVTAKEKIFEHYVTAPAGTATGILYVAAGEPKAVVRYTEMRLLGSKKRIAAKAIAPTLSIRNFQAIPVDLLYRKTSDNPKQKAEMTNTTSEAKSDGFVSSQAVSNVALKEKNVILGPFPRPPNLTPLDRSGKSLTLAESRYYFYHAARAMQRRAQERGMDFILFVMPDFNMTRLMPVIKQLRSEGIKVLAYEPQGVWTSGVDTAWYWQKADGHWTEAAVRLTTDEILAMWKQRKVANRPFSKDLMNDYATGFPKNFLSE